MAGRIFNIALLCFVTNFVIIRCDSVCCKNVGCFTDQEPFDHLYLPECPETMEMKFYMFNRGGSKRELTRKSIPSTFKPGARTIFIVHGWRNSMETSWVMDMKNALLQKEDANVVIVDWSKGAGHLYYAYSASNVRTVGAEVADMMDLLATKGAGSYEKTWCVGFSLGAHSCGQAGMRTERQIDRVTGLDPAGPKFDGYSKMIGVNPSSAKFVDIIHTDGYGIAAYYGLLTPLGHADFYPNAGYRQPGCWTYGSKEALRERMRNRDYKESRLDPTPYALACSHSRAPNYFIQSMKSNKGCFTVRQICDDHNYLPDSCRACSSPCTEMGYHASDRKHGKFYLETTSSEPFCKN